jgi:mono/diheme cytochrome c family protein
MTFSRSFVVFTTVLLCACSPAGKELSTSNSTVALSAAAQTQAARGLAFVEAQCSGCHAVRPGVEPPNPQAPSFVAVA